MDYTIIVMDLKELFSKFNKEDFYSKINLHIHSTYSDGTVDFDELIKQAKEKEMNAVLSNSFGFGGHNAVLVFKKH